MKYKFGEILVSKVDVEVQKALSDEKVIIPKGNRVIVGGDKLAHHLSTGMIQPFPEDAEFEGYDSEGIAEAIFLNLKAQFPLFEFMEEYEIDKSQLLEAISYALDDIGF